MNEPLEPITVLGYNTNDIYRRTANVLHQFGIEVTPTEVSHDWDGAFKAIRVMLRNGKKLVPKSDHDMVRWMMGLKAKKDGRKNP